MKINFLLSEFNITGKPIPEDVADKILKWHISPMQEVRNELGYSIWASQKSGYRPTTWEKSKGRSGNSQHTFKNKGAVDWTCKDYSNNKNEFLESIIKHTDYTRIAIYNSFIHCDYKETNSGKRELYNSTPDSKWEFVKFI
jgi:hypothetical protein